MTPANGYYGRRKEILKRSEDFFEQCEGTGVLSASEQHVLTKLKLEGLSAKELAQLDGTTSEEAVHHRSHRIMARLRKAASGLR